jgi:hypothetical protein
MRDGQELRKEREAAVANKANTLVLIAQQFHWLPYLGGDDDDVQKAVLALGRAVGQPISVKEWEAGNSVWVGPRVDWDAINAADALVGEFARDTSRSSHDRYVMTKPQHVAFCALWAALKAWGESRELQGRHDGSNILLGLATGEYSVADFNKHTQAADRHR